MDLCIDHHAGNNGYADFILLDAGAAAAAEVLYQVIVEMGVTKMCIRDRSRAHDIVQATVTRVDTEKGIVALDLGKGGEEMCIRDSSMVFQQAVLPSRVM